MITVYGCFMRMHVYGTTEAYISEMQANKLDLSSGKLCTYSAGSNSNLRFCFCFVRVALTLMVVFNKTHIIALVFVGEV